MMKVKRKPNTTADGLEPWLDWHIRRYSKAKAAISSAGLDLPSKLMALKSSWAGHIARMGMAGKPCHLMKYECAWRCRWWEEEQRLFNNINWYPIRHPADLGVPRRWEDVFSTNWMKVLSSIT